MVFDTLSNLSHYRTIHRFIPLVSEFISSHDCRELGIGCISLGNGITAILDEYLSVTLEQRSLECHRKFIDLQAVLNGTEAIGITSISKCSSTKVYDEEKDVELMQGPMDLLTLNDNDFVLFFPHDAHMPGLAPGGRGGRVKKMVVKIPV